MDFFDFRNMFLNMQFVPEYSNPLYLEELFTDDYRVKNNKNNKIQEEKKVENGNELIIPVNNELDKSKQETENMDIHED